MDYDVGTHVYYMGANLEATLSLKTKQEWIVLRRQEDSKWSSYCTPLRTRNVVWNQTLQH